MIAGYNQVIRHFDTLCKGEKKKSVVRRSINLSQGKLENDTDEQYRACILHNSSQKTPSVTQHSSHSWFSQVILYSLVLPPLFFSLYTNIGGSLLYIPYYERSIYIRMRNNIIISMGYLFTLSCEGNE